MTRLYDPSLPLSLHNRPPFFVNREAGLVRFSPQLRKVAIVAGGPSKRDAPLTDPSWEIWGLNVVPVLDATGALRADRWWEMHPLEAQNAQDLAWLARCPLPVYMPSLSPEVPNAVRYPLEAVPGPRYYACSFAYQLALALHEGFRVVGLYGVDLPLGSFRERTVEWACVAWWIGFLEGRGVEVVIPDSSPLGKHPGLYGYQYTLEKDEVERYEQEFFEEAMRGLRVKGIVDGA